MNAESKFRALALTLALAAAGAPTACSTPVEQPAAPFLPTPAQFDRLFPERVGFYSYEGFAAAVRSMPGFASTGPLAVRRQEMAAFLAQIAHESDRLRALSEYAQHPPGTYCRREGSETCAPGREYHGRGPIQLSWNYQYLAAGRALGVDLWGDPDLVTRDPKVAWQTAVWYWMTQNGPGRMTSHEAMVRGEGFGETIRSINGALECDHPGDADIARKVARRVDFYREAAALFDVAPGPRLEC